MKMQGIDRFKQQSRPEDRPASRDFKSRWNDWIEKLKEMQTLEENDLFDWRMSWGLTSRKFREEYLDPAIQRGIIETFGRPTKYRVLNSTSQEDQIAENAQEPEEPAKLEDLKGVELRAEMESKDCKDKCDMPLSASCKKCSRYLSALRRRKTAEYLRRENDGRL
jgi:hypothetical protein